MLLSKHKTSNFKMNNSYNFLYLALVKRILMKKIFTFLFILLQLNVFAQYDICVYGGTSAGVIAAYTAAKLNKKVILIEPGSHLGGLSSGGLGFTDIGNESIITGLSENFYRRLGSYYGTFEQWVSEPHVAEEIFNDYINEAGVPVLLNYRLASVKKNNGYIQSITIQNTITSAIKKTITAAMFIDCSYEGDLMPGAGVSSFIGRESNSVYNETLDGVQLLGQHQFADSVDPYKIAGNASSGLLWGISKNALKPTGSGDTLIQAYNYRICLTTNTANKTDITRPVNYDSTKYRLLVRWLTKYPASSISAFFSIKTIPNSKTDINNNGPFSTDMIGMNYNYPKADSNGRKAIINAHTNYTKGLLYFIGHDSSMPVTLRNQMLRYGYPKDEYTDNGNWTPQIYIRESRRLIGQYVMTQANCLGTTTVSDGIAMAAYTMDSHNTERLVVNGMVKNEGNVETTCPAPYPVSYRALIPKATECKNLYVPVCLSASHIAYGSIRMEPVFMVLAEACAAAASMAIDSNQSLQNVNVKALQSLLTANPLMDGSVPEVIVNDNDTIPHTTYFKGSWLHETTGGYGPTWLRTPGIADSQEAIFKPVIRQTCTYAVYTYIPFVDSAAVQTHYIVSDGTKSYDKWISTNVKPVGQTKGTWVSLGSYKLPAGQKANVILKATGANGVVVTDAILFVPKNNCITQTTNLYVQYVAP